MKNTILSKFVLVLGVVSVLVATLAIYFISSSQSKLINRLYVDQAESLANSLDASISEDDLKSPDTLRNIFLKHLLINPNIIDIIIHLKNNKGTFITYVSSTNNHHGLSEDRIDDINRAFTDNAIRHHIDTHNGKSILELFAPLHLAGQVRGVYHLIFSLSQIESFIRSQVVTFIILMTISTVLFMLSMSALVRSIITKPLEKLLRYIQEIQSGNFDFNIKLKTNDEIDDVVKSFSMMANKLKYSYGELEKRVLDKTKQLTRILETTQKQNLSLEANKTAMLNILEDEKNLNETLQKYGLALDSTSDHVIITDIEGTALYANRAVEKITGYSREEAIGSTPRLWGKQMGLPFYKKFWKTIKEDKKPFEGEIINLRKGNIKYYAYVTVSPILDGNNNLLGFVGVERDISEIKKYQINLEELVANRTIQLKSSIEAITRAYALIGKNEEIIFVNSRLTQYFGKPEGKWTLDLIIQKIGSLYDVRRAFMNCIRTGQPAQKTIIEYGTKFYDVRMSPVINNNVIIGALLLIGDTTEQQMLERSRDEFFSIASHELRTPLTAIRGNISLINDMFANEIKSPEFKQMLGDIHESTVRLISLVNDFLNTSRLEMGKQQFKKEAIDMPDLIANVLREYKAAEHKKEVRLEYKKTANTLPKVIGDRDKIKEVMINLLGNAIKFTENGSIAIATTLKNGMLEIAVTDTGRGIAPENQNLLFKKFQQAGSSLYTRDTTKGTGLGLYISKQMIEAMGGKIWLDKSEEGKGSTFAFTLPIGQI